MFKKASFLFFLAIAAAMACLYIFMIHISPEEKQAYAALLEKESEQNVKGKPHNDSSAWLAQEISLSIDDTFSLEADLGEIASLSEPLKLHGHIRLASSAWQDKKLYALAHEASYNPASQIFFLHGSEKQNVLCWQDGALFSAPKLRIREDLKTIEAVGDSRFSFSADEQKLFEQIFSRYL